MYINLLYKQFLKRSLLVPTFLIFISSHCFAQIVEERSGRVINQPEGGGSNIIIHENWQNSDSPWIKSGPDEHFELIAALRVSLSVLGNVLERDLTTDERIVLETAIQNLEKTTIRAEQYRENLCEDFKSSNYEVDDSNLKILGDSFNKIEVFIAEDVFYLFEETVSNLSVEAADALLSLREGIRSDSTNQIDWKIYSEHAPSNMKSEVENICRFVLEN